MQEGIGGNWHVISAVAIVVVVVVRRRRRRIVQRLFKEDVFRSGLSLFQRRNYIPRNEYSFFFCDFIVILSGLIVSCHPH